MRSITGGAGVAVVIDGVGHDTWTASLDSLAPRGLMISYGNASGPVPAVEPGELGRRGSLFLTRPSLFDYYSTSTERARGAARLFELIGADAIRVATDQRYPLADAARAHSDLEARATTGSTLLIP